jgi:hypothetical protein
MRMKVSYALLLLLPACVASQRGNVAGVASHVSSANRGAYHNVGGIDLWTDSIPSRAYAIVSDTTLPPYVDASGMTIQEPIDSKRERTARLVQALGGTAALMTTQLVGAGAPEYRVLSDRFRVIRYTQ